MSVSVQNNLFHVRFGLLFTLLTLLFGFSLGGAFGAKEHAIKDYLKNEASSVLSTVYKNDNAKMKKITSKSWVYFKRAHFHANGLGAIALGLILLISFLQGNTKIKSLASLALGVGSLGYAIFWLLAGIKAPGLGSTGAAKAALEWLAVPSAGLCIVGLVMCIGLVVVSLFLQPQAE